MMIISIIKPFIEMVFSLGLFINAMVFIPQAIKIYQQKHAQGVSLYTFGGFNILQVFTVLHGYLVNDYLLMAGFGLSFITCGAVTLLILLYGNKNNGQEHA